MSLDSVRALVSERQRFDDWLEALEARRGETPARVFERVHADYQARRTEVLHKLQTHAQPLAGLASAREAELQELEARLTTLEEERAEAMLRTAVGEFDAERWELVRTDVEAQLVSLGEERDGVMADLADTRQLLGQAESAVAMLRAAAGPDVVVAEPEALAEAEIAVAPVVDAGEQGTDGAEPTRQVDPMWDVSDESAVTASWLDAPMHAGASPVVESEPPAVVSSELPDAVDAASDLDFLSTDLVEPAATEAVIDEVSTSPTADADAFGEFDEMLAVFDGAEPVAPSAELPYIEPPAAPLSSAGAADAPRQAPPADAFDDLAFLQSIMDPAASAPVADASGQQKSLRCGECGTMNLPTEWYCERCGGELVNL